MEQAKLDRRVAERRLGRLSSIAVQGLRDQPYQQAQGREESSQERRDQKGDHEQPAART